MSDQKPAKMELAYQDDPTVREVYADMVRLVNFDGQTMHVELTINRPTVVGENETRATAIPAARLVMPLGAASQLRDYLNTVLGNLEKQGVLKRITAEPPARM